MNVAQLIVTPGACEKGAVIEAVGEVDLTTVVLLRDPVLAAVNNAENKSVIIDLCRVDFIDSAGLALLVEARKKLAPDARTLHVLLAPGRQPERVLRLGRFDIIMNLAYDLKDVA